MSQVRPLPSDPRYLVSDTGVVYGARFGRPLKQYLDRFGYLRITLKLKGQPEGSLYVHGLVLEAFVGPRPTGYDVLHGNGDKQDNRLENLRYGTRSENTYDMIRHGRHHTARRTECARGHDFSPENTSVYITRAGYRQRVCRACRREDSARYRARKAGAAA